MASANIIQVGDRTAGIVVREHGGFRFSPPTARSTRLRGSSSARLIRLRVPRASASDPARCQVAALSIEGTTCAGISGHTDGSCKSWITSATSGSAPSRPCPVRRLPSQLLKAR